MEHRVELLAPAGNAESFFGAVHAGADAVYLGGERFGARAYADNFTAEEILACIRYAHIWGRKVYLTVNTLVREVELEGLCSYLSPLYEGGLDGVIVQDIGVFALIRERFPQLKFHVSTQMTLTGRYGAQMLKAMGAVRVVPARELSLSELTEIKHAGLEVEAFVHGAMCYCYSGQCLFSSILGGRSGNRGRCAQPCRLPYRVGRDWGVTGECYPLSLKDMCTIEHIPELIEAGIDSFKIEGRMKKPEYAAGVTAIYRKWIDRYYESGERVSAADLEALDSLYIRSGRQDGYYYRHNGRDMVALDNPSYGGSDEALLREIRGSYLDGKPKTDISVHAVFRVGQPAEVVFSLERGGRRIQAAAVGETVPEAQKQPVTRENIVRQLGKLGDTSFQAGDMDILSDDHAFYPLKAINELRRQAAALLEDALITENGFAVRRCNGSQPCGAPRREDDGEFWRDTAQTGGKHSGSWHLSLQSREQFEAVADCARYERGGFDPARIYLEAGLLMDAADKDDESFFLQCGGLTSAGCELAIALPYILRRRDEEWLGLLWECFERYRGLFSGFLARSMDGLGFVRERCGGGGFAAHGQPPAVYGDAGLYVWNREAMRVLGSPGEGFGLRGFCMPYELKAGDQHRLLDGPHIPCEKIVYGRIPLMITANCIANTIDGCRADSRGTGYYLEDRFRKRFPVFCDCRSCMNIIYNSLPLSLHNEMQKWRDRVDFRLNFTIESGDETAETLKYFMAGAKGAPVFGEYTTGHEKRGAE